MPGINCTPHNGSSKNVYCCIIENEHSLPVAIDSVPWNPSDHIFPDSTKDGNLYVWLTEKENNDAYDVTVGTEKRQYSFDQAKTNLYVSKQLLPLTNLIIRSPILHILKIPMLILVNILNGKMMSPVMVKLLK